jgi:hypothetical protein
MPFDSGVTYDVLISKINNAWLVSTGFSDGDWKLEYDILRKNGNNKSEITWLQFDEFPKIQIKNLEDNLKKFKVVDYIYNINEYNLSDIVSNLITEAIDIGKLLPIVNPINIFQDSVIKSLIPKIRFNVSQRNLLSKKKYTELILNVRQTFSNNEDVEVIKEIVKRVYLSPDHKIQKNIFDIEGKRAKTNLNSKLWESFRLKGASALFTAVGSFGFQNSQALYFLAFRAILLNDVDFSNKNLRHIDDALVNLLPKNGHLLDLFKIMSSKKVMNLWDLIQTASLVDFLPNNEIFLFESSLGEKQKIFLENYYPDLKYVIIK